MLLRSVDFMKPSTFADSASFFNVDAITLFSQTLVIQTAVGAPLTVAQAMTVNGSGSLGLLSGGALNIDAPISVTGAGHQWPGGEPSPLAQKIGNIPAPSTALNATDTIWQFFAPNHR